ncbi:hypothetical protein RhiirC2_778217 [Rhizophagus irregularis]|uniref:Uncharacterized protein n=1 Tax=Rhizophagus irregularis TaxID=588596 RepID=A0A2N1NCG3_9GLOM|nr:hypothetical protein RhiirC2_778217 [Rhizophagus irregularis]
METTLHDSETFNKNNNAQNSTKADLKNNKKKSWSKLKCVKVVYKNSKSDTRICKHRSDFRFNPNGSAIQYKSDLNEFKKCIIEYPYLVTRGHFMGEIERSFK